MSVKTTVLARAGRVAGEIAYAGVGHAVGRSEEQRSILGKEVLACSFHHLRSAFKGSGAPEERPGLRVQEDTAFGVAGAAHECPIVRGGAPVPFSVPAVGVGRLA